MDDDNCSYFDSHYLAWCTKRFLVSRVRMKSQNCSRQYTLFYFSFGTFIFYFSYNFWILNRPLAIGALLTTITACTLCIVQIILDTKTNHVDLTKCPPTHGNDPSTTFIKHYPDLTFEAYFMAFGSIMFAFGGASTFPTIQADMKDKSKFKFSAYIAMAGKPPIVKKPFPWHLILFM